MENFTYDIPTRIHFGRGQLAWLKQELPAYGKRVLLTYGGGSIKKNGIYEEIRRIGGEAGLELFELSGVEANPTIRTVRRGIALCREQEIDVILAVGGGSVIDCSKAVAAGRYYEGDPWELVLHWDRITKALPILTVLTIAATGSEMDNIAVISNEETRDKMAMKHPILRPKVSILDPTYTFTVSPYQSASGVADILSHAMESYFAREEARLQDYFAESIMKVCVEYGPRILEQPDDYEARANLMWASSWAINDMLKLGHALPWSVHAIEHQLSAVYDITHGVGLAIVTPHWMEYALKEETVDKFYELAVNVWRVPESGDRFAVARAGIQALRDFYQRLGISSHLSELGIDETHFEEMAKKAARQAGGSYQPMTKDDIVRIYQNSL
ncbi:iron-containing alcohol dehydrogenase [bacterium 1XD21-13]|nr:iron-containing alcohol dehydrogenase [bacterium 1XD21-13]